MGLNPALMKLVEKAKATSPQAETFYPHLSPLENDLIALGLKKASRQELRSALERTLDREFDHWANT